MVADAVTWTEGKTDWQHLKRAHEALKLSLPLEFNEETESMGDAMLLSQCKALARMPQVSVQ